MVLRSRREQNSKASNSIGRRGHRDNDEDDDKDEKRKKGRKRKLEQDRPKPEKWDKGKTDRDGKIGKTEIGKRRKINDADKEDDERKSGKKGGKMKAVMKAVENKMVGNGWRKKSMVTEDKESKSTKKGWDPEHSSKKDLEKPNIRPRNSTRTKLTVCNGGPTPNDGEGATNKMIGLPQKLYSMTGKGRNMKSSGKRKTQPKLGKHIKAVGVGNVLNMLGGNERENIMLTGIKTLKSQANKPWTRLREKDRRMRGQTEKRSGTLGLEPTDKPPR